MLVEADMFSGRPNPRWVLTTEQEADLRGRLAALIVTDRDLVTAPGLGYRGFRCWVFANKQGPDVIAYAGVVSHGTIVLSDPKRSIERLLLTTIPDDMSELRHAIETDLNGQGAG